MGASERGKEERGREEENVEKEKGKEENSVVGLEGPGRAMKKRGGGKWRRRTRTIERGEQ